MRRNLKPHPAPAPAAADPLRLCREADLAYRLGISTATLRRWVRAGAFPRPLKLGPRASAWDLREVEAHLATLERV